MLEDEGHWLKLMRVADVPSNANVFLHISGSDVVCTVTSDISREVELRVTCRIEDQGTATDHLSKTSDRCLQRDELGVSEVDSSGQAMLDLPEPGKEHVEEGDVTRGQSLPEAKTKEGHSDSSSNSHGGGYFLWGEQEAQDQSTRDITLEEHGVRSFDLSTSPSLELKAFNQAKDEGFLPEEPKHFKNKRTSYSSDDGSTGKPTDDSNSATKAGGQRFQCPICPYFSYRHYIFVRHLKTHDSPPEPSSPSPPKSSPPQCQNHMDRYCKACNIQFMSIKTYQVHKQFYCNSRHDMSTASSSALSTGDTGNMSPSNEAVSSAGSGITATLVGAGSVIQPQAIFAAISTNPLILLPCSFISGQGLVTQNSLMNSTQGLVVPTSLAGAAVVDGNSLKQLQRQTKTSGIVLNGNLPSGALKVVNMTSFLNAFPKNANSHLPAKSAIREDESRSSTIPSKNVKAEEKSDDEERVEKPQEAPLDLSVRKRKLSPSSHSQRSVIKRRNSVSSPTATSPPLLLSNNSSSSPGTSTMDDHSTHMVRVMSPIVPHSDASCSSMYGVSLKTSSMPGRSSPQIPRSQTSLSDRMSPLPPVLPSMVDNPASSQRLLHQLAAPPPKIVKHGNNVCKECNIVFYKYDNYLAHKKHYCAYRRQHMSSNSIQVTLQDNPSASDDGSNQGESYDMKNSDDKPRAASSSRLNSHVEFAMDHHAAGAPTTSIAHRAQSSVYRCDVCGVKFSTSDNLNAHQTYYCSRQGEMTYPKQDMRRTSPKKLRRYLSSSCGEDSEDTHGVSDISDEWKCSYCEVICSSLKAARRHLLTHTEIRGFCCTICGYRGNTIRGMRSHIYEHLNIDNGQVEDLLASSVIVDHTGALASRALDYSDEDSNAAEGVKTVLSSSQNSHPTVIRNSSSPTLQSDNSSTAMSPKEENLSSKKGASSLYSCQQCEHLSSSLQCLLSHVSSIHGSSPVESDPHDFKRDYIDERDERSEEVGEASSVCNVIVKAEDTEEERILPDCDEESSSDKRSEMNFQPPIKKEPVDPSDDAGRTTEKCHMSVICKLSVPRSKNTNDSSPEHQGARKDKDEPSTSKLHQERNAPPKSELKYCKTCDISFHHLSNFIAHKKFYCVPRGVVRNFQQETTPVQ